MSRRRHRELGRLQFLFERISISVEPQLLMHDSVHGYLDRSPLKERPEQVGPISFSQAKPGWAALLHSSNVRAERPGNRPGRRAGSRRISKVDYVKVLLGTSDSRLGLRLAN